MRLDFFLPDLRKPKEGEAPFRGSLPVRAARAVLPGFLFSDLKEGKPGLARRILKRLGPSWLASPVRRIVQVLCFIVFCVLFFYVLWPYEALPGPRLGGWPSHYMEDLARKEVIEAELFLALDPLVSISSAVAARTWVWSLGWAAAILAICTLIPRGFCGFACPLGTLIDLFDWILCRRVKRTKVRLDGWWANLRYYVLAGSLAASAAGVMVCGFVAAIPVVTRAFLIMLAPLQMGLSRGWHQVPGLTAGHYVSIALFIAVLGVGLLRPRFWCRHVCPTGAIFSIGAGVFRLTERKVDSSCIRCGKCVKVCPFDAIRADFTTRTMSCTFCQTCGGVCPVGAIKFVGRLDTSGLKPVGDAAENDTLEGAPPLSEIPLSRRGVLAGIASGLVVATGTERLFGADLDSMPPSRRPIRPPGALPEAEFLDLCIRCGECCKACPNNVLQPMGFAMGLDGLWTPAVAADWSGCESSCNNCGQVCPTGAIRPLPLAEKKAARMGLGFIDKRACLPWAGREACQLCVDGCEAAGYDAIEFERVGVEVDEDGMPIPGSGFSAPVMIDEKCVGCCLCQSICYLKNVKGKHLLERAAVVIEAGPGREDRMASGSYVELRRAEEEARRREAEKQQKDFDDFY